MGKVFAPLIFIKPFLFFLGLMVKGGVFSFASFLYEV